MNAPIIRETKQPLHFYLFLICFVSAGLTVKSQTHFSEKATRQLIWSDEFETDGAPNPANWNFEYGFVRNQEQQWYQSQNARCENGLLIIEAKREKIGNPNYNPLSQDWRNSREYAEYSSSCLISRNLQEWQGGGYYEIRARIDTSKGSWPAIWLLGNEKPWPECGEIDIMEFYRINNVPTILANAAWGSGQQHQPTWDTATKTLEEFTKNDPDWAKKFHTWGMKWDSASIQIFLDDELLNEVDLSKTVNSDNYNPFTGNSDFYLLLNLAIGSNGGDPSKTSFPLKFEVDYVRVYKYL